MTDRPLSDDEILAALGSVDESEVDLVEVEGSAGTKFLVMGEEEAKWFTANMKRYLEEYLFENIADLQDLDRLLGLELLSYRYTSFLFRGSDYDGSLVDEKSIRDHKEKIDREIRQIKEHMGMSRKTRKDNEAESSVDFLTDLLRRAKEFGVHRDHQVAKAIDLFHELEKLVGLHDRCDEEERVQLGVQTDQIFDWVRGVAIPEFKLIDDAFRKNQAIWIRDLSR